MRMACLNLYIAQMGGSSGIGKYTAIELVRRGYTVYALSRHAGDAAGVRYLTADVTCDADIRAAVDTVLRECGRIDLLINNAGFGISGAIEFTDTDAAIRQFDVNFFGAVRMCRAVLPILRKQGGGRIVNIGSVAGVVAIPFQAYYSAAKSALYAYTLALANEVRPFGITAICMQPGDIRTGFTAAREKEVLGDDIYSGRISRSVAGMERDEQNGMSAEAAAKYIAKVADSRDKKPVRTIGFSYKLVCVLAKLLPVRAVNRLIGMLYAK